MYCTGDPDRAPVRCTEPSGYAHTGGEAAFAALSALWTGPPAAGRPLDAGVVDRREHGDAGTLPRRPGSAAAGAARTSAATPRDLADARRVRVVRAARRQGARPEPRDSSRRLVGDGIDASALEAATGATCNPNTRTRRGAARDREADRRVLRPAHHAGALRHRVRDEPDARTGQLAAGDPRQRAARGPGVLRARSTASSGSRLRSCRCGRTTAKPRRSRPRGRHRALGAAARVRGRRASPATSAGRRAARVGRRRTSSSSARAPPARSPPATSSSTARPCCAIESRAAPDFLRVYALGPEQPARPRGRADVRRAQRRQAQRHASTSSTPTRSRSCAGSSSSGPTRSRRTTRRVR